MNKISCPPRRSQVARSGPCPLWNTGLLKKPEISVLWPEDSDIGTYFETCRSIFHFDCIYYFSSIRVTATTYTLRCSSPFPPWCKRRVIAAAHVKNYAEGRLRPTARRPANQLMNRSPAPPCSLIGVVPVTITPPLSGVHGASRRDNIESVAKSPILKAETPHPTWHRQLSEKNLSDSAP